LMRQVKTNLTKYLPVILCHHICTCSTHV
jgi:hypothetical protein